MARIDTTEFRSNGVDIKEEELQAFTVKLVEFFNMPTVSCKRFELLDLFKLHRASFEIEDECTRKVSYTIAELRTAHLDVSINTYLLQIFVPINLVSWVKSLSFHVDCESRDYGKQKNTPHAVIH